MERWQAKLLALIGAFTLPLLATMLPYRLSGYVAKKGESGKRVLSYLMCFGGGIFFGTYLLHMGPDVHLLLDRALLTPYGIQYPLSDLLIGVGFFLVLFSEKFVLKWNKRRIERKSKPEVREFSYSPVQNGICMKERSSTNHVDHLPAVGFVELVMDNGEERFDGNKEHVRGHTERSTSVVPRDSTKTVPGKEEEEENDDEKEEETQSGHNHYHNTRSIILILALSMHRIFEGMTIGLQGSLHNIWSLFLAVMCHEVVIAFSLGLQLVKSRLSLRRMTVTSLVCSSIMPVGMAIGIVLTELGKEDGKITLANGVLQAIAMGTFIYVTFFEILQEEIDPNDTSLGKIFFIFAGFVMMALFDLIPEEDSTMATTPAWESSLLGNATTLSIATSTGYTD